MNERTIPGALLLLLGALLLAACGEDTGIFTTNPCEAAVRRITEHLDECGRDDIESPTVPETCAEAQGDALDCQAACLEDVSCSTLQDPSSEFAQTELAEYASCYDLCTP